MIQTPLKAHSTSRIVLKLLSWLLWMTEHCDKNVTDICEDTETFRNAYHQKACTSQKDISFFQYF